MAVVVAVVAVRLTQAHILAALAAQGLSGHRPATVQQAALVAVLAVAVYLLLEITMVPSVVTAVFMAAAGVAAAVVLAQALLTVMVAAARRVLLSLRTP